MVTWSTVSQILHFAENGASNRVLCYNSTLKVQAGFTFDNLDKAENISDWSIVTITKYMYLFKIAHSCINNSPVTIC